MKQINPAAILDSKDRCLYTLSKYLMTHLSKHISFSGRWLLSYMPAKFLNGYQGNILCINALSISRSDFFEYLMKDTP